MAAFQKFHDKFGRGARRRNDPRPGGAKSAGEYLPKQSLRGLRKKNKRGDNLAEKLGNYEKDSPRSL